MSEETLDVQVGNPLHEMADIIPADTPMAPAMGVAAMALGFALKYHDAIIVKDGAMYQQFKLEGKNLRGLTLNDVFDTAQRIELHLLCGQRRINQMLIEGVFEAIQRMPDDEVALSEEPLGATEVDDGRTVRFNPDETGSQS